MILLADSGLEGLEASVAFCDDCDDLTVHLSVPAGAPVCADCGDTGGALDALEDEDA